MRCSVVRTRRQKPGAIGLPADCGAPTCVAERWNIGHGGVSARLWDLERLDARRVVRRVEPETMSRQSERAEVADRACGFEAVELVHRVQLVARVAVVDEEAPVVPDADVVVAVTVHVGDDR